MLFTEKVIINELMWEYSYTKEQAQTILESYKSNNKFTDLCELIQYKMDVKNFEEVLLSVPELFSRADAAI